MKLMKNVPTVLLKWCSQSISSLLQVCWSLKLTQEILKLVKL